MPIISMFYGIIISMYFRDNLQHKNPHIQVKYQDTEAVVEIVLEGNLPVKKLELVQV